MLITKEHWDKFQPICKYLILQDCKKKHLHFTAEEIYDKTMDVLTKVMEDLSKLSEEKYNSIQSWGSWCWYRMMNKLFSKNRQWDEQCYTFTEEGLNFQGEREYEED